MHFKSLACMLCPYKFHYLKYECPLMEHLFVKLCAHYCVYLWYLCCPSLFKKSQGDISLNGGHKSVPPPVRVYGEVDCLRDEGLSEKSWLVGLVFCSLYISSQLRDKADKSAPPFPTSSSSHTPSCVRLSYLLLWCLLFNAVLPFLLLFSMLCWG